MQGLAKKRILVGITGGVAAYKAAELVRRLRDEGAEVQVVMTRGACEFITPLTLQAVSGRRVHLELFDAEAEAGMGHIDLARWADAILVAPASANFIARLTHGLADDLLTTLCLATTAQILLAPAMNQAMWSNPATQANIAALADRGLTIVGPASGSQACGEEGPGRMVEPAALITAVYRLFSSHRLAGVKMVVTAGPTREALDPVRFLSNRSSGRMGYAIARAAVEAGAEVVLISGPTALTAPAGVELISVTSAAEMQAAVEDHIDNTDIFVAAAAVADYRAVRRAEQKIKKSTDGLILSLERTPDILALAAGRAPRPFMVGFAAETENLEANARQKLAEKKLDLIAANLVGDALGFDAEDNELTLFWRDGERQLRRDTKERLARQLITTIADRFHAQHSDQDSQLTAR